MKVFQTFISAFLAGVAIALGNAASLMFVDNSPLASAAFFSVGLFVAAIFEFAIFTDNSVLLLSKSNVSHQSRKFLTAWLGNTVGALLVGIAMIPTVNKSALAIVKAKYDISFAKLIVGSILCGALIYIAMHGYRKSGGGFSGCAVLFAASAIISVCDFDFALANTFYIGAAFDKFKDYSSRLGEILMMTLFVTIGNLLGALIFSAFNKIKNEEIELKRHHHKRRHHHSHRKTTSSDEQA